MFFKMITPFYSYLQINRGYTNIRKEKVFNKVHYIQNIMLIIIFLK